MRKCSPSPRDRAAQLSHRPGTDMAAQRGDSGACARGIGPGTSPLHLDLSLRPEQSEPSCWAPFLPSEDSHCACSPTCVAAVVVVQNATVLDLKKAIQRYVQLRQEREGGIQHISW